MIGFCSRPFKNVAEMDAALIRNFNQMVGHDDETYFLGDMCFHKASVGIPLLRRLNGTKYLVLGNHDKWSYAQYRGAGFAAVASSIGIKYRGHPITLSHYPFWPKDATAQPAHALRYEDHRPIDKGQWLLCGHVHALWKRWGRQINVGVDVWNYRPVTGNQIASICDARELPPLPTLLPR